MTKDFSPFPADAKCHLCGCGQMQIAPAYASMSRVTSDCKPWKPGGVLAICADCHLVQTLTTPAWHQEAGRIYANYTIYHQSGGVEQSVFAKDQAQGRRRSEVIVHAMKKAGLLPATGSLLDLGCGNGAFLNAASTVLEGWRLHGSEWDDKYRTAVSEIRGFEKLHIGDWADIPGTFDVISMIHVLEHIAAPLPALKMIRSKLLPNGLLVIQVPDCQVNPYMLLIADHCSHFSVGALRSLVEAAGFEIVVATNQWVQKEITVVARPAMNATPGALRLPVEDAREILTGVGKLQAVLQKACAAAEGGGAFGIFGTSIAATWLASHLGEKVAFFVDEDTSRAHGVHMGIPICIPTQVPVGAVVFVALPQPLAGQVCDRNARSGVSYLIP